MGTITNCECECGYKKTMFLGCGMRELDDDIHRVAALCKDCHEVISVNDYEEQFQCHQCHGTNVVLYSDHSLMRTVRRPKRELKSTDVPHLIFSVFYNLPDHVILDALFYLCPKCGEFRMRINDGGCWD